jgi:hypothetical protein
MVIFDTETRTDDPRQPLLVGVYRYVRVAWRHEQDQHAWTPHLSTVEEGLFHPDDLDDGLLLLRADGRAATPQVDHRFRDHNPRFMVRSRAEFVERVLFRAGWQNGATIAGFNLPFDLSRVALSAGRGRALPPKKPGGRTRGNPGAVSLRLWPASRDRYRPRIVVLPLEQGARIAWGGVHTPPEADVRHAGGGGWAGSPAGDHFLDLAELASVLCGERLSLEEACRRAGRTYTKPTVQLGELSPELIEYCRADVAATVHLAEAIL